jgi:TonB-dependent SusC/RagA subfamily outer membrane receptor
MKQIIIALMLLFLTVYAGAQTQVIVGKLTVFNKYPVANVEVRSKKAKSALKSDSLGHFSIVCKENDIIKIKSKTFRPVTRRVDPETDTLTINLFFLDNERNRKLAVGYGYIDERDLLFAVGNLDQEDSEYCHYNNIFDLMTGRFAGVMVSNGAVYIRGITSITLSNEALYVVDGVITSNIDWIVPCEIKSINILKDASASIYGSRGANGVVVIETKKGS